ncbi:MAG: hypothetical protein CL872_05850 [Dehalococcoidaceae bacterium]|nr:hypothetical protein [Dehalococcoidaceae bacterium]MBR74440.1 hypothetical protein [Dehalococcoidaceae bacterium]|tara:strand:- start:25615 stop:25860 length:246 start_codon:yes stop_codon:yes gene_type:complete
MNNETIKTIIQRAVADFGFRQVVLYDFENINNHIQEQEKLDEEIIESIKDILISEMQALPIPVEPNKHEEVSSTIYNKLNL